MNWLRCFSVAPFGCQAPENLGSGKNFRSSNASPKDNWGDCRKKLIKKCKLHPKGQTASIAQTGLISGGKGVMLKKKNSAIVKGPVKKGALCLFLITIKAPQSLLTPKVLKSHQKDEKAVITGGSVSLRLGSLMQQGKNKNVQGQDGCEMGGGLGWQITLHDRIFRARKVLLSESHCVTTAHGHRASGITALDARTCAALPGSTGD